MDLTGTSTLVTVASPRPEAPPVTRADEPVISIFRPIA